ncbi:unnamed protein product, partial [Amoebophrya sp. A25]
RYPFTWFPLSQAIPAGTTNPCGVYVTTLTGNINNYKKKVHVVFEGVCSCVYLYIDGYFVGYAEDSMTGCEFD